VRARCVGEKLGLARSASLHRPSSTFQQIAEALGFSMPFLSEFFLEFGIFSRNVHPFLNFFFLGCSQDFRLDSSFLNAAAAQLELYVAAFFRCHARTAGTINLRAGELSNSEQSSPVNRNSGSY
jgi:hypothetical protein